MELKVYPDYSTLSAAAAEMIIDCVQKKPDAVLCFATGNSPILTYQIIAEKAKKERVDFSTCFFVELDEWVGIPRDKTGSCYHFLHQYLFKPLAINLSQIHLFDPMTANEEEECIKMNKLIEEKGPIDFMLVGVGMNGHIGFNEPGTDIGSMAHVSILDETTRHVGKKYFQDEVSITKGFTLGMKQVLHAETLLMMANGKMKAPIIKQTVEGNISNIFPASLLRRHKKAILMTDTEAASELETSYKSQHN